MTSTGPSNARVMPIAEVCAAAELEPAALGLLRDDAEPRTFVAALIEQALYVDAVRFVAHLLPKREAIFWAWNGARRAVHGEPSPEAAAALDATRRWIGEPSEANRRPMLELAEAADVGTPAGCVALAVFLSGGSIAPPELPPVEPDPFAACKAIVGSVVLAAVSREPERAPDKFRDLLAEAISIGDRIGLWAPGPPAP